MSDIEKRRTSRKRWKQKNKPKVAASFRRYQIKNRAKLSERQRQRQAKKRDAYIASLRARRAANPEKFREYQRAHKLKNPASWRLYGVRKSAKQAGIACDIDLQWIETRLRSGVCELSGLPFDNSKRGPNSPSIDRKNPSGPYTKENCRMILWWLNRALTNLGEEYALSVFRAILVQRGEIPPLKEAP